MDFLPKGYEKPLATSKYHKFANGDNKFRILSSAVVGWVDWNEENGARTPVRTKEQPEKSFNPKKPAKHFWAFVIWDYQESTVKVMEITQSTIQDAILNLHSDANWGNPTKYDIIVKKTGEKMETKYNIIPCPPKPISSDIVEAYTSVSIDLEKLFTNDDPFLQDKEVNPEAEIDTKTIPF